MISGTEYVLQGPHAFVCDDCQIQYGMPMYINCAYGKCFSCKREGFHQVFRTGRTSDEKLADRVLMSFILIVLLAIALWYFGVFK